MKIVKYKISEEVGQEVEMIVGAEICGAQMLDDYIYVIAKVDENETATEMRKIAVQFDVDSIANRYIATVPSGRSVFHVYEQRG
jgi:hypothetical protein